jgi:serine O-acetyltransferase
VTAPTAPTEPGLRQLVGLLREDRDANLREWRYPGFQALLAYRLGRFGRQIRPTLTRRLVGALHRRLRRRAARRYGIDIDVTAVIGRRVRISHQSGIAIHGDAVIGDDCLIRQGAAVGEPSDGQTAPVLGRNVGLGVGVAIANGVVIGDGARIGPNCVVTEDVPELSTAMPPRQRSRAP